MDRLHTSKAKKKANHGFTLIELAIVIAIIAILAAVAIPRLTDTTVSAECSMIQDMNAQLTSGMSVFTAAEAAIPMGFDNYVTVTAPPFDDRTGSGPTAVNPNISLARFGPGAPNGTSCTVDSGTISCGAGVFNEWEVDYIYNAGAPMFVATRAAGASDGRTCL